MNHTLAQKVWLYNYRDEHQHLNQAALASAFKEQFGGDLLKPSTISDWLKPAAVTKNRATFAKSETGADKGKRIRECRFPKLEAALSVWFFDKEDRDAPITDEVLREKAKQLGTDFPLLGVNTDLLTRARCGGLRR